MKPNADLHFEVKLALRSALKLVPVLRKQISDIDEDVMTAQLLREIELSAYRIVLRKDGLLGSHVLKPPAGPKK